MSPSNETDVLRANLLATQEALLDATDRLEYARALCRKQILGWRGAGKSQDWINAQPVAKAFYGPLLGS